MKTLKKVFYVVSLFVPICFANGNKGITINTSFNSPVAPFQGIAGCQIDILKIKSDKLAYGLGVNFDLTYDGWFGNMQSIKPEIVYTLKNPNKNSYYFYMNSGLGISFTHIYNSRKIGTEEEDLNGFGCHLDLIPSFKFKKHSSIGIGSWNSIVFHSKSRIKNTTTTFVSKAGIKFGFDMCNSKGQ